MDTENSYAVENETEASCRSRDCCALGRTACLNRGGHLRDFYPMVATAVACLNS